jgi:nucleotide-binding universal stress UspA family protein
MPTVYRVIVGAGHSPASLQALRYAQHLARDYNATLVPVLAWLPPCGDLADRRTPNEELRQILAQDARQQLQDALNLAWEHCSPTSLPIRLLVRRGQPGPVLARTACRTGDLLLVGAGRRSALTRIRADRVSRYCPAHARCPVLAVPPPRSPGKCPVRHWHGRSGTAGSPPARSRRDNCGSQPADTHPHKP